MSSTKKTTKDVSIETNDEVIETKKVASDKKYVVLTVSSYPVEVTKEQYDDIKNSAGKDGFIESESDNTIFIKVIK